jgi:hypothetical protein
MLKKLEVLIAEARRPAVREGFITALFAAPFAIAALLMPPEWVIR